LFGSSYVLSTRFIKWLRLQQRHAHRIGLCSAELAVTCPATVVLMAPLATTG
jgi:hypothetical protein